MLSHDCLIVVIPEATIIRLIEEFVEVIERRGEFFDLTLRFDSFDADETRFRRRKYV